MMEKQQNEDLQKSIDLLIDELFAEDGAEEVEKSIDIAKDAKTTADAVVNQAPKAQKDESRGAGRPKQISDVPQNDQDGARAKDYDAAITENEGKEDEPEEAKKQANSVDQTTDKGHTASKPAAPKTAPFKKSEEISEEEWAEFQAFKKSQAEQAELKKAESEKQEQEKLIKSAVAEAVASVKAENDELRKAFEEQSELIKAMAKQPRASKSITSIQALEKSMEPSDEERVFSKSEMLDAAEALVKSQDLTIDDVVELENTGTIYDPRKRALIEKKLLG